MDRILFQPNRDKDTGEGGGLDMEALSAAFEARNNPPAEGGEPGEGGGVPAEGDEPGEGVEPTGVEPTGEGGEPGEGGGVPAEGDEPGEGAEPTDDDEFVDLYELTGGRMENPEDIPGILDELDRLREEVKAPKEPQFSSEHQKRLYNLLSKYEGDAVSKFQDYLTIDSIDLDQISPKDALWQAFRVDPQFSGLSEAEKRSYFEDDYNERYQALEDPDSEDSQKNKLMLKQKVEATKAKAQLAQLQQEFRETKVAETTPESTAEQLLKIKNQARSSFGSQKALTVAGKNGENVFGVNIPISAQQKEYVAQAMTDIRSTWNEIMQENGAITESGEVDYGKYGNVLYRLKYQKQIDEAIYNQAWKDAEIAFRKKASQQQPGNTGSDGSPVGDGQKKKDKQEQMADAYMKALG